MSVHKPCVLILGKLPPPYIGPALATQILLKSDLKQDFELIHLDTNLNKSVSDLGSGGIQKIIGNITLYLKFARILKNARPDLVLIPISQTTKGFLKDACFIWIAARFKLKIVIQLRGSNFLNWVENSSVLIGKFVLRTLKLCNSVIVLGENLKYLFANYFTPNNIHVIPNGGDYPIYEVQKSTKIRFIYISNFLPGKGFKLILEALSRLPDELRNNIEFNAYGSWDNKNYKDQCIEIITNAGLHFIKIHDPILGNEKIQVLYKSDVFLFTPIHPEGHPWAIIEALSAGLPIISTNQGAISQSVVNEYNGILIEEINSVSLLNAIQSLIINEELRKEMGSNSRRLYESDFTEQKMINKYRKVFKEVIVES